MRSITQEPESNAINLLGNGDIASNALNVFVYPRERLMKKSATAKENEKCFSSAMRAKERGAVRARQVARMHGTRD
jgi:hypothetical protein